MSPLEELVIPLLKAHQIMPPPSLASVLLPLFLSAWHLTSPSLYHAEISLALFDSSRVMGNTRQRFIAMSVKSQAQERVKDGDRCCMNRVPWWLMGVGKWAQLAN